MPIRTVPSILVALALLAGPFHSVSAADTEYNPVRKPPVVTEEVEPRLIVKFRAGVDDGRQQALSVQRPTEELARRMSVQLKRTRDLGGRMHAMQVDTAMTGETAERLMERLRADPQVEYVQLDRRRHAHALPNDPLYTNQWYLQNTQPSSIRAEQAWDVSTGAANMVVAVVDTGVVFAHPDLQRVAQGGRLLPGYDFVSGAAANDGDDWDADPSDPGDWGCQAGEASSWHGTRVAGMIGARTNNSAGIAGITWSTQILPVRALGRCGGFDSDIIPAVLWAAGVNVQGVPPNPNPARVINMSLGSNGTCSNAYRDVFAQLANLGVLVVVSAGNDAGHAVSEPANCPGVLGVTGLRHLGSKVGFSNIGPEIGIAAPGGNCVNTSGACLFSLQTTTNAGPTSPGSHTYTDQFNINVGTSFSAPIVAGVAALVRALNTNLTPAQTIIRLQKTATAFPTQSGVATCQVPTFGSPDQLECNCTTGTCGAGMLNANAAVAAAELPFVIVSATPTTATAGQTVNLSGTNSFASDGRTVTGYSWTVVSSGGTTPIITGANLATASFVAPSASAITLRLTVTDSQGAQSSEDVTVNTPAPPVTPPVTPPAQPSGGGGGGGGSLFLLELLFLALLVIAWRVRSGKVIHSSRAKKDFP